MPRRDLAIGLLVCAVARADIFNIGFVETGGVFTTLLGPLGYQETFATGINDASQVVGYSNPVQPRSFLYSGGGYTYIDLPSSLARSTIARDINNSGQITGNFTPAAQGFGYHVTS